MKLVKRIVLVLVAIIVITAGVLLIPPSWPAGDPPPTPPAGMDRRCEVTRDAHGVPHLKAKSMEAAGYCWGFLHGQDRAWQLDFLRRVALGRVAERHGMDHAKQDFFLRLMDFETLATRWRRALKKDDPEVYRLLEYYVWGINQGMKKGVPRSYQFEELGFEPAPWRMEDSLAVGLLQSFYQTRKTFIDDLRHVRLLNKQPLYDTLSPERYGELFPSRIEQTTIIKAGEHAMVPGAATGSRRPPPPPRGHDPRTAALATAALSYLEQLDLGPLPGLGSNNWVISSARSESGHAMLANDPHLTISTPSFWYEVGIQVGEVTAMGVGVPGMPGIMSGNTRHLAWGLTNGYSNTADLFQVKPDAEDRFTLGGKSYRRQPVRPVVRVRMGPFNIPVFWKSFHRSEVGPFLPLPDAPAGTLLLRWTGFHLKTGTLGAVLNLLKARSVEQADAALKKWQLPCWNIVLADAKGKIGYRQVGLVARRKAGVRGFVDPTKADHQWQGFLTPDQMPHLLNPARGYIVTANNRSFPHGYPLYMGYGYAPGQRAARIEELIEGKPTKEVAADGSETVHVQKLTLEDMKRFQLDTKVPAAALLLPRMLELLKASKTERAGPGEAAQKALESWNLRAERELVGPTIFRTWVRHLKKLLYGNVSPMPRDEIVLRVLEGKIPSKTRPVATAVQRAFAGAMKQLSRDLGADVAGWRWGKYHRCSFDSLLKGRPAWSPGPHGMSGDMGTVNVASFSSKSQGPHDVNNAASYRLVVEMGPRIKSRGVLAGKQIDGRPKDLGPQQKLWLDGKYRPRLFHPDQIRGKKTEIKF